MPLDPISSQLLQVFAVAVGACVGSFLNVVIARVPHGRSIVRPGSACPRCGTAIRWYDNVPVLSWVLLRARCRACALPISPRYPAVELLVAAAALLAVRRHGLSLAAPVELALVALLVALAFIDLDTWLLPHALTFPLGLLGLAASAAGLTPAGGAAEALLGAALGAGAFWLVSLVGSRLAKQEAMGFGDVILLGALGAWLGVRALLPVILLSSVQGAVVGLALMALGRAQPGPPEPGEEDGDDERRGGRMSPPRPASGPPRRSAAPPRGRSSSEQGARGGTRSAEAEREPLHDDWTPPRNAVPFGPFLALAAVEWLYLAPRLAALVPALDLFL